MWSGISSLGRATRPSGNSGKSRTGATTEILRRVVAGARPLVPVGMPTTAIVWFRRDLRVHDHPSLTAAARGADRVVPVFVLDDALLEGRHASVPRTSFMLDCLRELREALRERGADLIVRHGRPEHELRRLAPGTTPPPAPRLAAPFEPGETAARPRMHAWLRDGIADYADRHDLLEGGTSELSPYLHFGCVSARELEARARAKGGKGTGAFVRQLAWRDFYAHVLLRHPGNARGAYKEGYDALEWADDGAA